MDLSVIIPVSNGAAFIKSHLTCLVEFLRGYPLKFEVIVVSDGNSDQTSQQVRNAKLPEVQLIELSKNMGKYAALTKGMSKAVGRCCVFTDADLPFDLSAIPYIAELVNQRGFQIVIGDRRLPESERTVAVGATRRFGSLFFSTVVRLAVTGAVSDTQCGLKGFRSDVAKSLFPLLFEKGFAGDVELIYLALKYNLEIKRIPVRWIREGPTTINLVLHGTIMLNRIARLPVRWWLGKYKSVELSDLGSQRYWRHSPSRTEEE